MDNEYNQVFAVRTRCTACARPPVVVEVSCDVLWVKNIHTCRDTNGRAKRKSCYIYRSTRICDLLTDDWFQIENLRSASIKLFLSKQKSLCAQRLHDVLQHVVRCVMGINTYRIHPNEPPYLRISMLSESLENAYVTRARATRTRATRARRACDVLC